MALHYIIDGYNVIYQAKRFTGKKLIDSRDGLIKFIEKYKPQGSLNNRVTVVFDGRPGIVNQRVSSLVKVIFSENESADDKIKKLVDFSKNPGLIVVVTNDRDIICYCRLLGASVKSVKEFLNVFWVHRKSASNDTGDEKVQLDSVIAKSITRQLENIWLKKK